MASAKDGLERCSGFISKFHQAEMSEQGLGDCEICSEIHDRRSLILNSSFILSLIKSGLLKVLSEVCFVGDLVSVSDLIDLRQRSFCLLMVHFSLLGVRNLRTHLGTGTWIRNVFVCPSKLRTPFKEKIECFDLPPNNLLAGKLREATTQTLGTIQEMSKKKEAKSIPKTELSPEGRFLLKLERLSLTRRGAADDLRDGKERVVGDFRYHAVELVNNFNERDRYLL
ncbi:hypothetical protein CEXT_706121 [Caerostris extrusa]|uniref:Uncharacterized protein n=1 Tax=Caerostris extrusa TaxID=172846 RepID=A0AAV4XDY7_CAEEX|nr:hypothetical protein CEXT_706121 [Caerostris extrusa]